MKAIIQDRYGPPETLELREVEQPVPAERDVLVQVHAASLNARDWHELRGDPYFARLMPGTLGLTGPRTKIRGTDFAGQVVAVGPGVTRLRLGDEVYGEAPGAFAELVCASESVMDLKPANLTFAQAAAVPLAATTALIGVRDLARAAPGMRMLINGASGGVGTFAVQLAKRAGAEVTGVCSPRNAELVTSLGADHIVDYTRADFTRQGRQYDVVLDLVANRSLADCRRALTPAGTLVLAGGGVYTGGSVLGPIGLLIRGMAAARFVRQRVVPLIAAPSLANLATLRELLAADELTPVIDQTFPLSKAAEALHYLEVEHARAKVVLTI